ncbi:MAG: sigma-54-dependent Fis family transcriptional regulator [Oceanospirillaceae bacterium]|nr:sigma-54-dependent Fis family transcriptional regulator [Oceanospirillaceae bacterium]
MKQEMYVVIIDDDSEIIEALAEMLTLEGFKVRSYQRAQDALSSLAPESAAVVLTDVRMPKMDGMSLLNRLQLLDSDIPVLLMSGHGDIPMAMQAMREGAYDFLEKPLQPEYLISQLRRAVDKRALILENRQLKQNLQQLSGIDKFIIGESASIKAIRKQVIALSKSNVDTIIYGATGAGKDIVARALHQYSDRRERRFIAINCGGMSESLIESELFGHEAGSFTGANKRHIGKIEAADGGTLFLDEIESMPISVQIKLLRVLQERSIERVGSTQTIAVKMTVIAASKDDLEVLGDQGKFRKDLFYRLNVASITIAPLSERVEDILPLFWHYVNKACLEYNAAMPVASAQFTDLLMQHTWPGNVRELKNTADRFVLGIEQSAVSAVNADQANYEARMVQFERVLLEQGLKNANGQVSQAAQLLNLTTKTLYRKMKKHQLDKNFYK